VAQDVGPEFKPWYCKKKKKKKSEIQRKGGHINMLFRIKKVNLDEIIKILSLQNRKRG
jgi:hypothetical protein